MAVPVKPLQASAQKWSSNASGASSEYQERAAGAADTWLSNASRASEVYRAAVSAGNIAQRFAAGVRRVGAAKYRERVTTLGGARYSQGVAAAQDAYSEGAGPYYERVASLTLSPRQPRGSDANYTRVREVGTALHQLRIARLGGTQR